MDEGYSWVICVAAFLCNFVVDGTTYSYGVLIKHIQDDFQSGYPDVALAGSLLDGCYLMSALFAGSVMDIGTWWNKNVLTVQAGSRCWIGIQHTNYK